MIASCTRAQSVRARAYKINAHLAKENARILSAQRRWGLPGATTAPAKAIVPTVFLPLVFGMHKRPTKNTHTHTHTHTHLAEQDVEDLPAQRHWGLSDATTAPPGAIGAAALLLRILVIIRAALSAGDCAGLEVQLVLLEDGGEVDLRVAHEALQVRE